MSGPRHLLIRNGDVALPEGGLRRADVLIAGPVIAAIGRRLDDGITVHEEIDASGAVVMPGGVDAHVHLQTEQGPVATNDDFTSGTAAAAFGGTTTILQFAIQEPGERFAATLDRWHRRLVGAPPLVDVGLHLLITDLRSGTLDDLEGAVRSGVSSFKAFMASEPAIPAGDLLRVMQVAARHDLRVMVHAEDGEAIDVLVEQALRAGHVAPRWHAETRPVALETAAAERAIELARVTGARLYLVHVGGGRTVEAIARARASGLDVVGETCPQYLLLGPECLDGDPAVAARMIFTPPPRSADERDALWRGLAAGDLSTVASDHSAFRLADKAGAADFTGIAQGIPGVETRLPLLHHAGVGSGRLSWSRFVELVAEAPARAFGLWPRKGALRPGSDADVVIFDPRRRQRISAATHHMGSDYSPYEGYDVVGGPRMVIVGGRVVIDDGQLRSGVPQGRLLLREPYGYATRTL